MALVSFRKAEGAGWAEKLQSLYAWTGRRQPPPKARTQLARLLLKDPAPLIDPDKKLVVIFSPKAACTNVLIWFLHHLGHLQAARDFHDRPHEYRQRVYYQSALYRGALGRNPETFTVVRVIRDPYERATSSFRHLLRNAKGNLSRHLGMTSATREGLSFSEFIDRLDRLDLMNCDAHLAVQRHPVEDLLTPNYLINVSKDDLFGRLRDIERDLRLPPSDLENSEWVERRSRRHRPGDELTGADLYTRKLSVTNAIEGPWPRPDDLLTAPARERLARLYAIDLKSYFSDTSSTAVTP